MSASFHLPDPDHFTAGAVGPPGRRTFYLQVGESGTVVSLKLEKQQVAALAEYLGSLLADRPEPPTPPLPAPPLVEPVEEQWIVGGIGLALDDSDDRVVLVVHEFVPEATGTDEAIDEVADLLAELTGLDLELSEELGRALAGDDEDDDEYSYESDDDEFDEDGEEGATVRMRITLDQARAFIVRAGELMAASRPLCPFCGLPSDPDGHFCPREN